MKMNLLAVLFLVAPVSFANNWYEGIPTEFCPGGREVRSTLVCARVSDAFALLSAEKGKRLAKLPKKVDFKDAMELGVLPDADSSMVYFFGHELLNEDGRRFGYLVIHGYVNSEMGRKIQLTTRYNLEGKLTSISHR